MSDLFKRLELVWNAIALGDRHGQGCLADRTAAERIRACSHRAILK